MQQHSVSVSANPVAAAADSTKLAQKSAKAMAAAPQYEDIVWPNNGSNNVPPTHGSVSVFTTVYSGLPGFTTGPHSYNAGTVPMYSDVNGASSDYGVCSAPTPNPKTGGYYSDGSYAPEYARPAYHNGPSAAEYQTAPPPQAAINAAQVAAAAVATATATATAVAIDQTQFPAYPPGNQNGAYAAAAAAQQYPSNAVGMMQQPMVNSQGRILQSSAAMGQPQIPPGYMPNTRPRPVGGSAASRYVAQSAMANTRQAPYAVPQAPYGAVQMSPVVRNNSQANHMMNSSQSVGPAVATGSSYARFSASAVQQRPGMHYPTGAGLPSQQQIITKSVGNYGMNYGMQQNVQQMTTGYQGQMPPNMRMNAAAVASLPPSSGSMLMAPNNVNGMMSQQSPFATSAAPPYGDVKPVLQTEDLEPRISFPVKDGVIMQPFRLEHNVPVSQLTFFLSTEHYNLLYSDPDADLQLKCFHADDRLMSNNWPHNANIQIYLNNTPVAVRHVDRPLYVKNLCQPNKNTLQIAVEQCCCSHLFMLNLISRPTVERIVNSLVRRRLLPVDVAIEKIKRSFHSGEVAPLRNPDGSQLADVELMSANISLKCPITMTKIVLPARGQDCRHIQCFDLKPYVMINKDRFQWQCPICGRQALPDNLEIDQYIWGILANLAKCPDVDEVCIDSSAAWKANVKSNMYEASLKEQIVPGNMVKRFKTEPLQDGAASGWGQASAPMPNYQNMQNSVMMPQQQQQQQQQQQIPERNARMMNTYYQEAMPHQVMQQQICQTSAATMGPAAPVQAMQNAVTVSGAGHVNNNNMYGRCTSGNTVVDSPQQTVAPSTPKHQSGVKMPFNSPPTPVTPLHNPPSVGGPRSVGGTAQANAEHLVLQQQPLSNQMQLSIDGSAAGSAPYTPASVSSAGSQHSCTNTNVVSTEGNTGDFSDLTFDANDLLPNDTSENLGNFFVDSTMPDPGEFIQYFENSSFGDFGISSENAGSVGNRGSAPAGTATDDSKNAQRKETGSKGSSSKPTGGGSQNAREGENATEEKAGNCSTPKSTRGDKSEAPSVTPSKSTSSSTPAAASGPTSATTASSSTSEIDEILSLLQS